MSPENSDGLLHLDLIGRRRQNVEMLPLHLVFYVLHEHGSGRRDEVDAVKMMTDGSV